MTRLGETAQRDGSSDATEANGRGACERLTPALSCKSIMYNQLDRYRPDPGRTYSEIRQFMTSFPQIGALVSVNSDLLSSSRLAVSFLQMACQLSVGRLEKEIRD